MTLAERLETPAALPVLNRILDDAERHGEGIRHQVDATYQPARMTVKQARQRMRDVLGLKSRSSIHVDFAYDFKGRETVTFSVHAYDSDGVLRSMCGQKSLLVAVEGVIAACGGEIEDVGVDESIAG